MITLEDLFSSALKRWEACHHCADHLHLVLNLYIDYAVGLCTTPTAPPSPATSTPLLSPPWSAPTPSSTVSLSLTFLLPLGVTQNPLLFISN
jgi:hypothetical protein